MPTGPIPHATLRRNPARRADGRRHALSQPTTALAYRPEIDGLRAIAVAAVVLYHADESLLPGGFVGVDVFFVISGYLITALLAGEWGSTGRIDFAAFYARRVRRLLPALTTLVVVVMIAAVVLLGRHGKVFDQVGNSAAASLLFVANFWFQMNSGGYFDDPAAAMPLLHLWSLAVEEQYYFVYPALLALLLRLVPGGVPRRLAVFSVASLLLAEYWVHILPERAFFQMPARFWELAAGGLVALSSVPAAPRARDRWMLPLGVLVVLAASVYTPHWGSFPGIGAIPAVAGAVLVLLGVHRHAATGVVAAALRSRPLVTLGLLSYSLYLWHWPLLVFDFHLHWEPSPTWWRLLLCVAAVALAWLSWRFIEMPFRTRRAGAGRTLLAGAALTSLALVTVALSGRIDRVPADARKLARVAQYDLPDDQRCHLPSDEPIGALDPADCSSASGVVPGVVVWGDSHAMAWRPLAASIARHAGVAHAGLTMNGCPPSGRREDAGPMPERAPCADLNDLALSWFETGKIDTVIMGMRWPLGVPGAALQERLDGLDAALRRMGAVRRVLVMGPLPWLKRPAPECITLGWVEQCAVTRAVYDEAAAANWLGLRVLAARFPNVELVDAGAYFCDDATCPVMRDGYAQYWDNDHISATAARAFADQWLADPARYDRTHGAPAPPEDR